MLYPRLLLLTFSVFYLLCTQAYGQSSVLYNSVIEPFLLNMKPSFRHDVGIVTGQSFTPVHGSEAIEIGFSDADEPYLSYETLPQPCYQRDSNIVVCQLEPETSISLNIVSDSPLSESPILTDMDDMPFTTLVLSDTTLAGIPPTLHPEFQYRINGSPIDPAEVPEVFLISRSIATQFRVNIEESRQRRFESRISDLLARYILSPNPTDSQLYVKELQKLITHDKEQNKRELIRHLDNELHHVTQYSGTKSHLQSGSKNTKEVIAANRPSFAIRRADLYVPEHLNAATSTGQNSSEVSKRPGQQNTTSKNNLRMRPVANGAMTETNRRPSQNQVRRGTGGTAAELPTGSVADTGTETRETSFSEQESEAVHPDNTVTPTDIPSSEPSAISFDATTPLDTAANRLSLRDDTARGDNSEIEIASIASSENDGWELITRPTPVIAETEIDSLLPPDGTTPEGTRLEDNIETEPPTSPSSLFGDNIVITGTAPETEEAETTRNVSPDDSISSLEDQTEESSQISNEEDTTVEHAEALPPRRIDPLAELNSAPRAPSFWGNYPHKVSLQMNPRQGDEEETEIAAVIHRDDRGSAMIRLSSGSNQAIQTRMHRETIRGVLGLTGRQSVELLTLYAILDAIYGARTIVLTSRYPDPVAFQITTRSNETYSISEVTHEDNRMTFILTNSNGMTYHCQLSFQFEH